MQLLMLAAYHQPIQEALTLAAQLLARLPASGGTNYLYLFVHYIMDWAFIEQVTGVNQPKFQLLKRQLTQLMQTTKEQTANQMPS